MSLLLTREETIRFATYCKQQRDTHEQLAEQIVKTAGLIGETPPTNFSNSSSPSKTFSKTSPKTQTNTYPACGELPKASKANNGALPMTTELYGQSVQQQPAGFHALVEIMGHQRFAGYVTEQTVAGASLVRVDVPETPTSPPFSKLFGGAAIYAMTPCDERTAQIMAERWDQRPIQEWELIQAARIAASRSEARGDVIHLSAGSHVASNDYDDDDDESFDAIG